MFDTVIKKPEPIYRQIATGFQQRIERGLLNPGDALPTTLELAKQFNIASKTAQNALTEMTKRGLIVRIPGKGTFVTDSFNNKTIALVAGRSLLSESDMSFYSKLTFDAADYLNHKGWNSKIYSPTIPDDEEKMINELEQDISQGKVRSIVVITSSQQLNPWLKNKCTVPWINIIKDFTETKNYEIYYRSIIHTGFEYLVERNITDIKLLYSSFVSVTEDAVNKVVKEFTDNSPVKLSISSLTTHYNYPEEGMQAVMNGISPDSLPQVLFCLDDNLCSGAIMGLLAQKISFPEDIFVLTHANEGINILSPKPLTRIEFSTKKILHNNIDALINQVQGRNSKYLTDLKPVVIRGESC